MCTHNAMLLFFLWRNKKNSALLMHELPEYYVLCGEIIKIAITFWLKSSVLSAALNILIRICIKRGPGNKCFFI